jgi:hypothetical protein
MNHPSIPKTSLDVTSANHGILAVWRTVVYFPSEGEVTLEPIGIWVQSIDDRAFCKVEVLSKHLLEKGPAMDGPVHNLCEGKLHLAHRDLITVAKATVCWLVVNGCEIWLCHPLALLESERRDVMLPRVVVDAPQELLGDGLHLVGKHGPFSEVIAEKVEHGPGGWMRLVRDTIQGLQAVGRGRHWTGTTSQEKVRSSTDHPESRKPWLCRPAGFRPQADRGSEAALAVDPNPRDD